MGNDNAETRRARGRGMTTRRRGGRGGGGEQRGDAEGAEVGENNAETRRGKQRACRWVGLYIESDKSLGLQESRFRRDNLQFKCKFT